MKVKSNLDEVLYDRIIESLIRGDYAMGQKLSLDELAETFEVSRTPVVQAVKLLSNDGVLQVMSNGRIYVPEYQLETIRQICEVRQLIEGHALELLFSAPAPEREATLQRLEHHAQQCREVGRDGNFVELATADRKFHRCLVESAGNAILTETYTRIQGRFIVANYLLRPLSVRDYQGTVDGHAELLAAIAANDPSAGQQKLKYHIDQIIQTFPAS